MVQYLTILRLHCVDNKLLTQITVCLEEAEHLNYLADCMSVSLVITEYQMSEVGLHISGLPAFFLLLLSLD